VWDVDANGLRIVSEASGADYHPTAADVVRGDASREMLRKLHANEAARARIQRDEKDDAQRTADVYVCLADSIRAGNCLAGSQAWAERAGMDLQAHYRAAEVRLRGGSEPRVRLAITAARMRHEREMYQGYAVLAEHSLTG